MNDHKQTYDTIKKDFCHLFQFKTHGDTLELITPLVTLTDKFVSVFVTQRGEKLIITDGGWINQNIYEYALKTDDIDIVSVIISQYKDYYNIQRTVGGGYDMYYKSVTKSELLSAAVFDIANFIVGVVNSYTLDYRDKKDKEERDRFRTETNDFFKEHYRENFKSNFEVERGIRFNGVLTINQRLHLFEYVTGSTSHYFEQDLRSAIVDFRLIEDTPIIPYVENRIAIFNDLSAGYKNGCPPILVNLLDKYTNNEHILRSKREQIFSIISPN
jgi:hypothetical protein